MHICQHSDNSITYKDKDKDKGKETTAVGENLIETAIAYMRHETLHSDGMKHCNSCA